MIHESPDESSKEVLSAGFICLEDLNTKVCQLNGWATFSLLHFYLHDIPAWLLQTCLADFFSREYNISCSSIFLKDLWRAFYPNGSISFVFSIWQRRNYIFSSCVVSTNVLPLTLVCILSSRLLCLIAIYVAVCRNMHDIYRGYIRCFLVHLGYTT